MEDSPVQTPETPAKSPSNRGEAIAKIGTIVSAIMASACCWLPLVLLAVGVSGAGIAATLEAYRPYFMVVTFAFLGTAFYYTYRPKQAAANGGHACCGPEATEVEDCCATASKGRFNIMTLNNAMLWVVTVLAVAFLFFPSYVGAFLGGADGETVTPSMNRATLTVEGMTCEGCATLAEKAIRSVPGVLAVEVDYQRGQAVVGTEACCPVPREEILAALEKAGYGGSFSEPGASVSSSPDQAPGCCAVPKTRNGTTQQEPDPNASLTQSAAGDACCNPSSGLPGKAKRSGAEDFPQKRILAPEGSELLMELCLAIKHGITVKELALSFHAYLTLGEAVKLAAITFGKDVSKLSCCAT